MSTKPVSKRKLSTLTTQHRTLEKEISNINNSLEKLDDEIRRIRFMYTPEFHGDDPHTEELESAMKDFAHKKKELNQKLKRFESQLHEVSSSVRQQTSIKEHERNKIRNQLNNVLRENLNPDVRNKVNEYIGELVLSNNCVYNTSNSRKSSNMSRWFGGKSRKQRKSMKSAKSMKSRKSMKIYEKIKMHISAK